MPIKLDAAALKQLCKECDGYTTPQLNDKLYGNFRGYSSICNEALGRYTGIKSLFLEGNALHTLEDMPQLDELMCLFVQRNAITSLQGLQMLRNLVTLNVANNYITTLKGLEACPHLTTLNASHNQLTTADSLDALLACPLLTTVDIQSNQIDDPAALALVTNLPHLASLYLAGNPIVSHTRHYRNTLISMLPTLCYLDDRPVFEVDRAAAEAWAQGGYEAARVARAQWGEAQRAQQDADVAFMVRLRDGSPRQRRKMLGIDNHVEARNGSDMDNSSADETSENKAVLLEEHAPVLPEELRVGYAKLAKYVPRPEEDEPQELTTLREELAKSGLAPEDVQWQPLEGPLEEPGSVLHDSTNVVPSMRVKEG